MIIVGVWFLSRARYDMMYYDVTKLTHPLTFSSARTGLKCATGRMIRLDRKDREKIRVCGKNSLVYD
jgi:hypothetical protein